MISVYVFYMRSTYRGWVVSWSPAFSLLMDPLSQLVSCRWDPTIEIRESKEKWREREKIVGQIWKGEKKVDKRRKDSMWSTDCETFRPFLLNPFRSVKHNSNFQISMICVYVCYIWSTEYRWSHDHRHFHYWWSTLTAYKL